MKTKKLLSLVIALAIPVMCINFAPQFASKQTVSAYAADDHYHNGWTFDPWKESTSLPSSGSYYLTRDVEISSAWTPQNGVQLCLNGFGIRLTGEGNVITAPGGGTMSIYDCQDTGSVKTHKYRIDEETGLAIVDDTLTEDYETFAGGYITGGNGARGSGIYIAHGAKAGNTTTFNRYGGTIIGNHTEGDGGGISYSWGSRRNSHIRIDRANIIGNVADGRGGGIFHEANNRSMSLSGGKILITKNVSGSAPAGVLEDSELDISGDIYLYGNHLKDGTPSDLIMNHPDQANNKLVVTNSLSTESRIGIDYVRFNRVDSFATYNDFDPNDVFFIHSGEILDVQGDNATYLSIDEDAEAIYDGEGHAVGIALPGEGVNYTVGYGLEEGTYDLTTPPAFTELGSHRYYYEIVAGLNVKRGHVDVNIVKPYAVITLAPTAVESLSYTGEAQTLVIAGQAEGGTMEYRVDEGEWDAELPMATTVGSHKVEYRVVGDDDHRDLAPVTINVTIAANDKTALSQAIVDAQAYLDTVKDAYAPLITDMEAAILAATAVRDDPNKTVEEIDDAADSLSSAKTDLEGAIAALNAAIAAIDAIDDPVTLDSEEGILAARAAYDGLNEAQQSLIDDTVLAKLTDAEATLTTLKVNHVTALIEAIGEVTLDKEDAIIVARAAYDALTDDQKAFVDETTLKKLTDAEAALVLVKADKAEADKVRFMIEAIGEVTLDKEDVIIAARAAYDALTDDQKAFVDEATLKKLTDAEAVLAALKADKAAIDHVKELIEGIGIITLEKENDILAARAAYDALTDAQKAQVSQYLLNMLRNAEKTLAALKADKAAIDGFKALVEAVGEVDGSDACLQRIEAAKSAYAALTEGQQAAVGAEYQALLQKEQAHYKMVSDKRLATTFAIVGIALGGVLALLLLVYAAMFLVFRKFAIEPVNEKVIRLARVGRKADIVTLLTPRLKKVRFRENDLYGSKGEARAVLSLVQGQRNGVIAAIRGIGEVDLDKEEAIRAAREAYEALNDQQKAKIEAKDVQALEEAETALIGLKAKEAAKSVESLIAGIGRDPTKRPDAVEAARKAYEALSETERSYLSAYATAKLESAEALLRDAPKEEPKKKGNDTKGGDDGQ